MEWNPKILNYDTVLKKKETNKKKHMLHTIYLQNKCLQSSKHFVNGCPKSAQSVINVQYVQLYIYIIKQPEATSFSVTGECEVAMERAITCQQQHVCNRLSQVLHCIQRI